MFKVFSHVQTLVLSSGVIKVLSRVRDLLKSQVSPFCNLKSLKLQKEYVISTIPSHVESYLLNNFQSTTKSSMIGIEYRTVAVNGGICGSLSALVDQLDRNGIADINDIGVKEARTFPWGYQFWSLVTAKSNVKAKGVVPATYKVPVVSQSLEEGNVKNKDVLCCTTIILAKALTKVLVKDSESSEGDAVDEVEHHVKVLDDVEQIGVPDEYFDVGIPKDKFVKSGMDDRVEEQGGQQRAGGGALLVTGKTMVISESLLDQVNVVCRETEAASERAKEVATSALIVGNGEQMNYSEKAENSKLLPGDVEDKELLAIIKRKYPETFYCFTPQSEMIRTVGLNTLCTALKTFSKVYAAEVTVAKITEYKSLVTDLEGWGFNLDWLVKHLNFVEQLRFSSPLVDELTFIDRCVQEAQIEVQKQQSLHATKMMEIREAFGQFGANLAAGCIGDMLFENHSK